MKRTAWAVCLPQGTACRAPTIATSKFGLKRGALLKDFRGKRDDAFGDRQARCKAR